VTDVNVPKYIVHDLDEVQDMLGEHEVTKDTFVRCSVCDTRHYQNTAECSGCGIPVIWKHSPIWKDEFGNPNSRIRELNKVKPTDRAGTLLMLKAKQTGFANKTEARKWSAAVRKIGDDEAVAAVEYCARGGVIGRPLIAHALNLADKKARESKPKKQRKKREVLR
jgi:hypothetical protein